MTLLVVATAEHARELAAAMRVEEVAEVRAALDLDPAAALAQMMGASVFSRAMFIRGELATVFGVIECPDGAAWPWLLSTPVVDKHPLAFWRASKRILAELLALWPVLVEYVDARYEKSIRWARRLGWTIAPAEPHGALGLPFHPMAIQGVL